MIGSLKETRQFERFQEYVVESVSIDSDDESEDQKTKKAIKSAFKKKIKKQKKAPRRLTYKNEDYIVDNWIECEKCKTWRIVNKDHKKYPHFICKNINKKCKSREIVPKSTFTIN